MRVHWKIGANEYPMMRVRPHEIELVRKSHSRQEGIPHVYALLSDGDVDWWPDCSKGMPIVYLDPNEIYRLRQKFP